MIDWDAPPPHMLSPDQFAYRAGVRPPLSAPHTPAAVETVNNALADHPFDAHAMYSAVNKPMSHLARLAATKPTHFRSMAASAGSRLRDRGEVT